jgi:hypothetical protein
MQREHPDESNDNMKHEHADEQGYVVRSYLQ